MAAPRGAYPYADRTYRTVHNVPLPTNIVAGDIVWVSLCYASGAVTATAAVDGVAIALAAPAVAITGYTHRVYEFRADAATAGNTFDITLSSSVRISCDVMVLPGVPSGSGYVQTVPTAFSTTLLSSTTKTSPAATSSAANTQEIAVMGDTEGGAAPGTTLWSSVSPMSMVPSGDYNENGAAAVPLLSTAFAHNPTLQASGVALGSRVFTESGGSGGAGSAYTFLITTSGTAPTANAGPDQTGEAGQTITLAGSGGTSYSWQPDSRLTFSATNIAAPTMEIPPTIETTVYTNTLTVTDGSGVTSAPDTMTVTGLAVTETAWLDDGTVVPLLIKPCS